MLKHFNWRALIVVVVFALALYAIVPQLSIFKRALPLLEHARMSGVLAAVLLTFVTYLAAAGTYYFLAFRSLSFARTTLVIVASVFVNRLLPAGAGGIGTLYAYLKRSKHSNTQAGVVVAVNNLLGFVGHMIILIVTILVFRADIHLRFSVNSQKVIIVGSAILIVVIVILAWKRRVIARITRDVIKQLSAYRKHPFKYIGALGTSIILTLCNILALYFAARAVGAHITLPSAIVVFTVAQTIGTATPTPGGLGGFEVGLTAALVATGVNSDMALASALLYRLIAYWLTFVLGALTFPVALARKFI